MRKAFTRMRKLFFYFVVVLTLLFNTNGFVRAQTGPTSSASISAQSQEGDNGWYVTGVTVTITATAAAGVKSITFWLNNDAPITVNASQTTQTFSQNGNNTLYFYATDNNNVQESPTKTLNFKVDTISPVGWSNITQVRDGNAHTFRFSATVNDASAGLDPTRTYMQYNVDDTGTNWGYYSNLLNCNSQWQADQWYQLPTQSFAPGATSGTIETVPVDYCNSSGAGCDFMKVRVFDMAGNYSDRKICLGAPWVQTQQGDVHSASNISMLADGPQPNATYVVGSQGSTITSFTSSNNWYMPSYTQGNGLVAFSYSNLLAQASNIQPLPAGRLPTTSGYYIVPGNFTISSAVIPAGYSTAQNFATVILVSGTVTINTNITTHPSSTLMIVSLGNINVDRAVTLLHGIYIAGSTFDTSYNGNNNVQLRINGSAMSFGGFDLARTLGTNTNKTTPAELFVFQPQYLLNKDLSRLLVGTIRYDWKELSP